MTSTVKGPAIVTAETITRRQIRWVWSIALDSGNRDLAGVARRALGRWRDPVTAIDFRCPKCGEEPGSECASLRARSIRNRIGVSGAYDVKRPHRERTALARTRNADRMLDARIMVAAAYNARHFEEPSVIPDDTCPDHWHCHPHLAAHTCDAPDRSRPCPTCGHAPRPVTGPDGDNPITDEQIREICAASPTSNPIYAWSAEALAGSPWSRARCAEAWNARMGG